MKNQLEKKIADEEKRDKIYVGIVRKLKDLAENMGIPEILFCPVGEPFLTCKKDFNMNKMLHRREYAISEDTLSKSEPVRGLKALGITREFSFLDKVIYIGSLSWGLGWFVIFIIGTTYAWLFDVPPESWVKFWHFKLWLLLVLSFAVTIWLTIGGFRDMRNMLKVLLKEEIDENDDGRVFDHRNLFED